MINVRLKDLKSGRTVRVNDEGSLEVVVHPHPPKNDEIVSIPFRQYFTDDGKSSGSFDMRVDGSTNNQEFFISADNDSTDDKDIYINTLSFVISDQNASLNQFGALTALTNGVEFQWKTNDKGTVVIADALKTNFDFVRLCNGEPAFGTTTNAFRASNVSGNSEGYIPIMDLEDIFGIPYGLRLRANTEDRLSFIIKDNVSTIDAFNIIAYGFKF